MATAALGVVARRSFDPTLSSAIALVNTPLRDSIAQRWNEAPPGAPRLWMRVGVDMSNFALSKIKRSEMDPQQKLSVFQTSLVALAARVREYSVKFQGRVVFLVQGVCDGWSLAASAWLSIGKIYVDVRDPRPTGVELLHWDLDLQVAYTSMRHISSPVLCTSGVGVSLVREGTTTTPHITVVCHSRDQIESLLCATLSKNVPTSSIAFANESPDELCLDKDPVICPPCVP